MTDLLQNIDWIILHGIHETLSCSVLDFIMPKITMLGNSGIIWIVFAIGLVLSKKYRKYGFIMFGALAMGLLVGNICMKNLIARPRPCWLENVGLLFPSN